MPFYNPYRTYMKKFYTESKWIEKLRDLQMLESFIKQKNKNSELILFSSLCNGVNHFEKKIKFFEI